jgi:hypothetical protein
MTRFILGRTDIAALHVDLARLVDTRLLVQANSGGGKSWLLRLIAERAAGKVQIILLDPEGEFATLREKLDIALVGQGGEMPTDLRAAELLACKLVEHHISAIVDLYDLKLADRRKYVRLFLEALMTVSRAQWHPLLVLLDECHLFAPERAAGESESTEAVIALMSQGRKRGFAGVLSTQRLSKLHKDAAAEANNVVIGRTWLDIDQQRAGDLLGMNKADRQALRDLDAGEFFAFGPALSHAGIARFRSDPVATTHPKAGQRHLLDVPPASAAIQDIVAQIGDLPAQAVEESRTLEAMQRRVHELERDLRARPVQIQPKVEQRIETPVFKNGEVARLEGVVEQLSQVGTQLVTVGGQLATAAQEVAGRLAAVVNRPAPVVTLRSPAPRGETPKPAHPASLSVSPLPKAERSLLAVLAQYPQGRNKSQLAILSGYAVNGGGFNNAISALRSPGFLAGGKDRLNITPDGLAALGDWDPLPTGPALRDYWLRMLSKAERACLAALIEYYPNTLDRDNVARAAGYTPGTGGVNNALSRLRTLELITGRDQLKASDVLFE